eukprot:Gregarina_sp_Pseudo_9__1327@NODE_188_length_3731_cov_112_015710_g173_i0_p1_GENE_NODE_188_length_3731_cov_112_015710_g173_i0NODE_188_length_3731_cov_112_015710_g173_i0_p1_ORF_typecomplete_len574_score59_89Integrin_beta/PF00362_18/2_6e09Integrin_beta/PF00362_18/0_094_NODE_188_length_3731_cov_112_015710_g173_i0731794
MNFPVISLTIAAFALAREECNFSLELLVLQEATWTSNPNIGLLSDALHELWVRMQEEVREFSIGVSSFSDKPIPLSGYGDYGAWGEELGGELKGDYCYKGHASLSLAEAPILEALQLIDAELPSGFDAAGAQTDAMIYAALDADVGWSDPKLTHSPAGWPIVRILLLITNAPAHEPGDAVLNIDQFNEGRRYPSGYYEPSVGGFGSHSFVESPLINAGTDPNRLLYLEMADLFAISDAEEAGENVTMSYEEYMRILELIDVFGPYMFPGPSPHPGDASVSDCQKVDYPSMQQAAAVLRKRDILPFFLTSSAEALLQYQATVFPDFGGDIVVSPLDAETFIDTVFAGIQELAAPRCSATTPEPPSSETTIPTTSGPPDPETTMMSTSDPPDPETTMMSTLDPPNSETIIMSTLKASDPETTMLSTLESPNSETTMMSTLDPPDPETTMISTLEPPDSETTMILTVQPPVSIETTIPTQEPPGSQSSKWSTTRLEPWSRPAGLPQTTARKRAVNETVIVAGAGLLAGVVAIGVAFSRRNAATHTPAMPSVGDFAPEIEFGAERVPRDETVVLAFR